MSDSTRGLSASRLGPEYGAAPEHQSEVGRLVGAGFTDGSEASMGTLREVK